MISREDISIYKYREAKSLLGYVGAKADVNKSQKILQPKQMDKKMKDIGYKMCKGMAVFISLRSGPYILI